LFGSARRANLLRACGSLLKNVKNVTCSGGTRDVPEHLSVQPAFGSPCTRRSTVTWECCRSLRCSKQTLTIALIRDLAQHNLPGECGRLAQIEQHTVATRRAPEKGLTSGSVPMHFHDTVHHAILFTVQVPVQYVLIEIVFLCCAVWVNHSTDDQCQGNSSGKNGGRYSMSCLIVRIRNYLLWKIWRARVLLGQGYHQKKMRKQNLKQRKQARGCPGTPRPRRIPSCAVVRHQKWGLVVRDAV
jgi:hypothetical protein